jgi:hypothetical protein
MVLSEAALEPQAEGSIVFDDTGADVHIKKTRITGMPVLFLH